MRSIVDNFHGKRVEKLACLGYTEGEIAGLLRVPTWNIQRDFAPEFARGRSEFEAKVRQFRDLAVLCEGADAIYYERYLIAHVRVSQIRITDAHVKARIRGLHSNGSWDAGCVWPYFYSEKQLWLSDAQSAGWRIFFAREVIEEVDRIELSFPSTDEFKPYDEHYRALVKPIERFVFQTTSEHLHRLNEQVNRFKAHKDLPTHLLRALETVATTIQTHSHNDPQSAVGAFIQQVESASGTSLTEGEVGQLIEEAHLIERVSRAAF